MKNLLFIRKSNPQIGGVEKQMIRIACWLRDNNIVQCFLATDDLNSNLAQLFRDQGFTVFEVSLNGKLYLINAFNQLKRIIFDNHITFLQAHMFRESIVCRMMKFFNPSIIHIFRIETYIDCSPISSAKKSLYHKLASLTANQVNYYIANGNIVATELHTRSGVPLHNIEVIFNGVEKFGEKSTAPIVFDADGYLPMAMAANFVRGKGHELLFDAIEKLNSEKIKIKVYLFGDDMDESVPGEISYKNELMQLCTKKGIESNVVFKGFSNNLEEELRSINVVLLPSYSEGTPNTILEAMSAGKLVVASNVGELSYMIENGVSGFVHQSGNVKQLAGVLKRIATTDSKEFDSIRENGYQRWLKLFSLEGMMNSLVHIYKNNQRE